MTIYLTDDAFSVKAKRFNKMFTSILAKISELFYYVTTSKIKRNVYKARAAALNYITEIDKTARNI